MLALVEPLMFRCLVDAPYLGAATLMASCAARGVEMRIINGQTSWLRKMFVDGGEELWHLITDIRSEESVKIDIGPFQAYLRSMGESAFRSELRSLYGGTVAADSPRDYFNAVRIDRLGLFTNTFLAVHRFYIEHRNHLPRIWSWYVGEILRDGPSYVGFSLHGRDDIISRAIRKSLKSAADLPMIAGGPVTPFFTVEQIRGLFDDEAFDYVIVGEGDVALPELIQALDGAGDVHRVPNLIHRRDGEIRYNEPRPVLDLDDLPVPDFSPFDLRSYLVPVPILPVLTARGCPWGRCGFCSHYNVYQRRYRALSIDRVMEILQQLHAAHDCTHFVFHDEDMPAARARSIGRAVLDLGLDLKFCSYARLSKGYDDESLMSDLYEAGFRTLVWGLESGSQKILDSMEKGTDVSVMRRILKKSSDRGMANICFVMFGFPGETRTDAEKTVSFLQEHAEYIHDVSASVFDLELASPIGRNPKRWGVTVYGDGTYAVDHGMSRRDALLFHRRLSEAADFKMIRIAREELRFVMPGHNRRMLRFLASSHGLIPRAAATRLHANQYESLYVMAIGEAVERNGRRTYYPYDTRESLRVNKQHPVPGMSLGPVEARLTRVADGTKSLAAVLQDVSCASLAPDDSPVAGDRAIEFLGMLIAKGYALAFSEPIRR